MPLDFYLPQTAVKTTSVEPILYVPPARYVAAPLLQPANLNPVLVIPKDGANLKLVPSATGV